MSLFKNKNQDGVTLLELLVSLGILAVSAAILLPATNNMNQARGTLERMQSFFDIKQPLARSMNDLLSTKFFAVGMPGASCVAQTSAFTSMFINNATNLPYIKNFNAIQNFKTDMLGGLEIDTLPAEMQAAATRCNTRQTFLPAANNLTVNSQRIYVCLKPILDPNSKIAKETRNFLNGKNLFFELSYNFIEMANLTAQSCSTWKNLAADTKGVWLVYTAYWQEYTNGTTYTRSAMTQIYTKP